MGDNDRMEEELSSSPSFDLHSIQSQINEMPNIHRNGQQTFRFNSDSDQLLNVCSLHIESKMKDVISEYSDVASLDIGDLCNSGVESKEEKSMRLRLRLRRVDDNELFFFFLRLSEEVKERV
ncbi:hypothetical protein ACFE04_008512 [Oxalis oulophora]